MSRRFSRRHFLGLGTAGAIGTVARRFDAVTGAPRWISQAAAAAPDLVVFNAKVYTMDAALPRAEAFAITGGKFSAIGRSADIRGLAGAGTELLDAKQMTIVPGFI